MSLINDALKKASKPGESPTPPPGGFMEAEETSQPNHGKLLLSVFVLIGLVLVTGTFFYLQQKKGNPPDKNAQAAKPAAAAHERSAAADHFLKPLEQAKAVADKVSQENLEGEAVVNSFDAPTVAAHPTNASVAASAKNSAVAPASNPAKTSKATLANSPKPNTSARLAKMVAAVSNSGGSDFPDLKLNAIYYRLHGPSVVINGKTLHIGDTIEGAKVTDIQRMSVEVESNGQKKALALH